MADRQVAELVADALQAHKFDPWYQALLMGAVDRIAQEHKEDLQRGGEEAQRIVVQTAIGIADEQFTKNPKAPDIKPATDDALSVFGGEPE
jgi:hypothetical protein